MRLLKRGGSGVFLVRVAALLVGMGVEAFLTRTLGKDGYGVLAIGIAWLNILAVLAGLGVSAVLVRYVAAYEAQKQWGRLGGLRRWSTWIMLGAGGVSGFGLAVVTRLMGLQSTLGGVMLLVAVMVPLKSLIANRQALLQGLKHPVLADVPEQLIRPVAFAVVVLAFTLAVGEVDAVSAAALFLVSLVVATSVAHVSVVRSWPAAAVEAPEERETGEWWGMAFPILWAGVMHLGIGRADPAMLGWLATPGAAGLYAVAFKMAEFLIFGIMAINVIAAPLISQLHSTGERRELQRMLSLAAKGIAVYTIPLAVALLITGPWLLPLVFGEEFGAAYPALAWLVAAKSSDALAGSVGFLLAMTGYQVVAARILTVAAILKIALNFLLIPRYGEVGAAVSSAITTTLWNCWLYFEVRRRLGYEPTLLALLRRTDDE